MSRAPESPSVLSVLRPSELRRKLARWLWVRVGLPSELQWTTRRPDVAGYYWVRAPKLSARVSHFYHAHGQHWLTSDYLHLDFAYGKPVEYAGPLPKPPVCLRRGRALTARALRFSSLKVIELEPPHESPDCPALLFNGLDVIYWEGHEIVNHLCVKWGQVPGHPGPDRQQGQPS